MTAQDTPRWDACPVAAQAEALDNAALPRETRPSFPWAVPSWVMPGSVAENADFVAGQAPEMGLLFFEAESSALMPEEELPRRLRDLPLRWHIHLPSSLPGHRDLADNAAEAALQGSRAAEVALRCWQRAAFLQPRLGVLHLPARREGAPAAPETALAWLDSFFGRWREGGLSSRFIVLENVRDAAFSLLRGREDLLSSTSLCLDMAHALAYGQRDDTLQPFFLEHVGLMHWSAPGAAAPDGSPRDRHLPLDELDGEQKSWLTEKWWPVARDCLAKDTVHLIEVFNWAGIQRSLPVLEALFHSR